MKKSKKLLIIIIWLAIWQTVAVLIGKPYLFASFTDSILTLYKLVGSREFYIILLNSCLHCLLGFVLAMAAAILTGIISYRYPLFRDFIDPAVSMMKSVPVASFVILVLVWFGSRSLSIIVSFAVVFPVIYFATVSGLQSTDEKMLEMAEVFRLSTFSKVMYIYRLALTPYLISSCMSAVSMGWKSAIAAEVISASSSSIGGQLYLSKIYLDTSSLFAWTFVIIILSSLFEKAAISVLRKIGGSYGDYLK